MGKILNKFRYAPLDVKIFILNPFLLIALFFFPEEPNNVIVETTYMISIFVSIAVSSFFMTYVRDSDYNILRKTKNLYQTFITIFVYILFILGVSYILAITEWFF
jgi:hypothetical protein